MAKKKRISKKNRSLTITIFVVLLLLAVYFGYQNITGSATTSEVFSGSAPVLSSPPLSTGIVLVIAFASMFIIVLLSLAGRYK